ncbi:hypothetical protein ES708_24572 [subsurface metagenome]
MSSNRTEKLHARSSILNILSEKNRKIDPSTDKDWFKLYTGGVGTLTISVDVQNPTLDVKFIYYDAYPGDFLGPWPFSSDFNGKGENEEMTVMPPLIEDWVYIKVELGSQGGCGAYKIDVTLTQ